MSKGKKILIILVTALVSGVFILGGVYLLKFPPSFSEASKLEKSLKIDDFKYNTQFANVDGEDKYVLSLTNNSEYQLIAVGMYYKIKSDLAESEDKSQLSVFDDYVNEVGEGSKVEKVILFGEKEAYVAPNTSIENIPLYLGIASQVNDDKKAPTKEQLDVLEPSTLMFTFIVNDKDLYNAYYDITKQEWDVQRSSAAIDLNQLQDKTNEKLVPNLQGHLYYSTKPESEGMYSVTVFNFTQDEFKTYVESLKSQGFTENIEEGKNDATNRETFQADDSKGNSILVTNDYTDKVMKIGLNYK